MIADFLHRALSVGDLDVSVPFYRDALGFLPVDAPEVEEGAWLATATGQPGARRVRQTLRNAEGIALELYAFQQPAPVGSRERRKNNMFGLTHLAFYVDSVDEWAERIGAAGGSTFPHTRATFRDNGTTMMYCTDPDGIRVELMQAPGEGQRFSHSGICMDDVERSLAFYEGLAGFRRSDNYELYDHGYFMNVVNELDDVKLRAQMIRNERGDTLELLQMTSPPAFGPREPLPLNRYGLNHLAFRTDDPDKAAQVVVALGGRVLEPAYADTAGCGVIYCADPVGARIALVRNA